MLNSSQCLPFKFNLRKFRFYFTLSLLRYESVNVNETIRQARLFSHWPGFIMSFFSRVRFSLFTFSLLLQIFFLYKNKQQFLFVKFYEPNFVNTEASSRWKQYFFLIGKWRKKRSNFRASSKICIFIKGKIIVSVNDSLRVEWIWKKMLENIKTE